MNNKCGCGQGFVPVSGNWDFNMDGGSMPGCGGQRQRQNRCNARETADEVCRRDCQAEYTDNGCTGRADCSCERCARRREAACNTCAKNACTRQADCSCEE